MKRNMGPANPRGGQPPISSEHKSQIKDRLLQLKSDLGCKTTREFAQRLRSPRTTPIMWLRSKGPVTPTTANLIALHQETSVSIDWVLFGKGAQFCSTSMSI